MHNFGERRREVAGQATGEGSASSAAQRPRNIQHSSGLVNRSSKGANRSCDQAWPGRRIGIALTDVEADRIARYNGWEKAICGIRGRVGRVIDRTICIVP